MACALDYECTECGERFAGNKLNSCSYHTNPPFFGLEPTEMYYPCCNVSMPKFDTGVKSQGCCAKHHQIECTDNDDSEYKSLKMVMKNISEVSEQFDYKKSQTTPEQDPDSMLPLILTPYQQDQTIDKSLCLSTLVPEYIKQLHSKEPEDDIKLQAQEVTDQSSDSEHDSLHLYPSGLIV